MNNKIMNLNKYEKNRTKTNIITDPSIFPIQVYCTKPCDSNIKHFAEACTYHGMGFGDIYLSLVFAPAFAFPRVCIPLPQVGRVQ